VQTDGLIIAACTRAHQAQHDHDKAKSMEFFLSLWSIAEHYLEPMILLVALALVSALVLFIRPRPQSTRLEPYGSFHLAFNASEEGKPETQWLNMGYWKVSSYSIRQPLMTSDNHHFAGEL
jgi:hypothetical protein